MRKALALLATLAAMAPLSATAQQANQNGRPQQQTVVPPAPITPYHVTPGSESYSGGITPEMWFYNEQMRRHDDPKLIIRRRAQQRTAERQRRIETRKWYGYSAARPRANPTPAYGSYAAQWVGNDYRRNDWVIPRYTSRYYTASRLNGTTFLRVRR